MVYITPANKLNADILFKLNSDILFSSADYSLIFIKLVNDIDAVLAATNETINDYQYCKVHLSSVTDVHRIGNSCIMSRLKFNHTVVELQHIFRMVSEGELVTLVDNTASLCYN